VRTETVDAKAALFRLPPNRRAVWFLMLAVTTCSALGFASILGKDAVGAVVMLSFAALLAGLLFWSWVRLRRLQAWRVAVGNDAVEVALPAERSVWQQLTEQHACLPYASIDFIETRVHSHQTPYMAFTTQGFALKLKNSERIILGEEEASEATGRLSVLRAATDEIRNRSGLELRNVALPISTEQVFATKSGWRVAVGSDAVDLNIPASATDGEAGGTHKYIIPFADIEAIETRFEPGGWFRRSDLGYALRLKSGPLIRLGRSRAFEDYVPFAWGMADPNQLWAAAEALSKRSGIKIRDFNDDPTPSGTRIPRWP
jgi:hypothetical protein